MELRTRAYDMEARYYCDKCAVFLDQGQEKNPNFTYLPKEEFDKINDHAVDDSVLNVLTPDQILSVLLSLNDIEKAVKYFMDQGDRVGATVKFYGEMVPSGPMNRYIDPKDRSTQIAESLHQCNNPSCKVEMMLHRDYPYLDKVVGRVIRTPEELQHHDDIIKNVMKKHIGSTVNKDFVDAGETKDAKEHPEEKEQTSPT